MKKFILLEACTGDEVTPDEAAELQELEYPDGSPKYTICKEGGKYYAKRNLSPDEKKKKTTPKPTTPKPPKTDPKPNTPPVDKTEIPDRSNDIPAYLECEIWEDNNLFNDNFSGKESQKAKEFKTWLFTYKPKGNSSSIFRVFATNYQAKYDNFCSPKTNDYESKNELHKAPFIREMALWETINPQGDKILIYDMWYELTQKNSENTETQNNNQTQTTTPMVPSTQMTTNSTKNTKTSSKLLPSENFDSAQEMFDAIKETEIYTIDADVQTKVNSFEKLYRLSNETVVTANDRKSSKACSTLISQYITIAKTRVDKAFGNPITSSNTDLYPNVATFWYEFLETLITIKSKIFSCREKGYTTPENGMALRNAVAVVDSPWPIQLEDEDSDYNTLQSFMDKITVESLIKRKLIEKLEDKTLKESIRKKLLLKSTSNGSRVNKISENLYRIAGDFYNERYDVFFNKYVKLKESYKKSKMFLMEGASDNFKNAFIRVFKGDEEELVRVAIPWFTNKLGLEGSVKSEVEEKLKNKYSGDDIANLFDDDWSDIVVSAIIKNAKTDVSEPTNAMDAVEKALISNMRSDFKEDLKNSIKNLISPIQDSRKTEIENLSTQLKNALLASKDGEESQEDTDSKVDDIFS